ncbi:hypothetical protein LEP1GSC133_5186 [Leptospira borgpetersenii serovar Pomona str. 200901868]|uniref:Uncharacterized protein n=1 Tax=Leptospira borgpetersenii serovar Pomona str. 200901868 TaxID=1192866 RepID=M6VTP5_LEPBO|nr:hypothetical protein LEP1GSC133_5186 [Leptospira borgpetersenii serovar Pomona str. 200901868]
MFRIIWYVAFTDHSGNLDVTPLFMDRGRAVGKDNFGFFSTEISFLEI